MGIFCRGNIVVTCIQDVCFRTAGVICLELVFRKGNAYRLTCAGCQLRRFSVADQLHGRLFHTVCFVVIRIGALYIKLHNVLACHIAGVGDSDLCRAGVTAPVCLKVAPIEGRIAQAVTERIHDLAGIVVIARITLVEDNVLIPSLVIAVADINAFLIRDVVILCDAAVFVIVGIITEVLRRRGCRGIGRKGVHRAPAGADLAGQHIRHSCADGRRVKHRLDVGVIGQPVQLQRCVGVYDQHCIVVVIIQVLQNLTLGGVRFQIAADLVFLTGSVVVHRTGHITALACHTLENVDRGRALYAVQQTTLTLHDRERALVDTEVLGIAVADGAAGQPIPGTCTLRVEIPQCLVHVQAALGQGRIQRRAAAHQPGTHILLTVGREQTHGRILGQGQGAVIFQQNDPFIVDAVGQVFFGITDGVGGIVRRVIVQVQALGLYFAVVPRFLVAQHCIYHAGVARQNDVGCKQQHCHDNCQHSQNTCVQNMAYNLQWCEFFLLHFSPP